MLLQTFSDNEVVQVLDPATSIWESAKILSFVSDWCVRIKWVDWSSKKEDVTVPEKDRADKNNWNVRKSQGLQLSEKRTNKRRSIVLDYNARKLVKNDEIYFWQPECECIDNERCQEDTCCGSVLMGWVTMNDPFNQQCLVKDEEMSPVYVSYRQLRNKPSARDMRETENEDTHADDEDSGSDEVNRPPAKKQARVTFAPQTTPKVDILTLLPIVEEDVSLTYAPCLNDIVKVIYSSEFSRFTFSAFSGNYYADIFSGGIYCVLRE